MPEPSLITTDCLEMPRSHLELEKRLVSLLATEKLLHDDEDQPKSSWASRCASCQAWREKVSQWCYDVADQLQEKRSVVYVAMNILDRYCLPVGLCSEGEHMTTSAYEQASLTSIFLAVRIAGSGSLNLQDVVEMSRRGISVQSVIATGTDIIKTLDWDHRIVTPFDYLATFTDLLPSAMQRTCILESSSYLAELAVCDALLACHRPSDIALAAFMNAVCAFDGMDIAQFSSTLTRRTGMNPHSQGIISVRQRLHELYTVSYDYATADGPHLIVDDEDEDSSSDLCAIVQSSSALRSISQDNLIICAVELANPRKRKIDDGRSVLCKRVRSCSDLTTLC